jgi:hypothetical protein
MKAGKRGDELHVCAPSPKTPPPRPPPPHFPLAVLSHGSLGAVLQPHVSFPPCRRERGWVAAQVPAPLPADDDERIAHLHALPDLLTGFPRPYIVHLMSNVDKRAPHLRPIAPATAAPSLSPTLAPTDNPTVEATARKGVSHSDDHKAPPPPRAPLRPPSPRAPRRAARPEARRCDGDRCQVPPVRLRPCPAARAGGSAALSPQVHFWG